jgi:hypothetical protein
LRASRSWLSVRVGLSPAAFQTFQNYQEFDYQPG